MGCRPNLIRAGVLAGLVCGFLCFSGIWIEVLAAPGPKPEASSPKEAIPEPPISPPKKTLSSRPLSARFCQPAHYEFLAGGFLSSLLCHYVFGYPLRSLTENGLWPPGLLDLLALTAVCYVGYWMIRRLRRQPEDKPAPSPPAFLRQGEEVPPSLRVTKEAEAGLAAIEAADPAFDLEAFREEVLHLLNQVYEAWNRQELEVLDGRLKDSLLEYLRMGLRILFLREENSYLEDLVLKEMTVTAASINDGKEFITVCFQGSLFDYVVDKRSGKLLAGSMAYPTPFREYWDLARPRGQGPWMVMDIRDN